MSRYDALELIGISFTEKRRKKPEKKNFGNLLLKMKKFRI